jgi:predicted Zn-dependent peptidase
MLGRVLGDGLASRMNAELVDRQGLAYSLHAGITRYADCGLFEVEVAVAPDRASEAVRAILGFARSASRFRFSSEELLRVRRRYRYAAEFRADSAADLSGWHGTAALFRIEPQVTHMASRIDKVSAADVRQAARSAFRREGLVIAAAGSLARGEWGRVREVVADWNGA